jgi:hypothetical protein
MELTLLQVVQKVSDLTSGRVVTAGTSGAIEDSANLTFDGSNLTIGAQGDLRLADTTGGEYVGLQAPTSVSASYTLTFPAATGTADQILSNRWFWKFIFW